MRGGRSKKKKKYQGMKMRNDDDGNVSTQEKKFPHRKWRLRTDWRQVTELQFLFFYVSHFYFSYGSCTFISYFHLALFRDISTLQCFFSLLFLCAVQVLLRIFPLVIHFCLTTFFLLFFIVLSTRSLCVLMDAVHNNIHRILL